MNFEHKAVYFCAKATKEGHPLEIVAHSGPKRAFSRIRAAYLGCAIALLCFGCQKDEKKTAEVKVGSAPVAVAVGEIAKAAHYDLQVNSFRSCDANDSPRPPKEGFRRISVRLNLTATGDETIAANPFYGILLDEGGEEFRSSPWGCEKELSPRRLQKSESTEGTIAYDIPIESRGIQFRYLPYVAGYGIEETRVNLNRR